MSRVPTWRWPTACLVALVASASASGREIHYGAAADPALLACDVLEWRGKLSAAEDCYRDLLGSDREAAVRAEAAWALDDLQLANRLFRDAAARYPDDASIRVRWGDLFADSHQDTEAMNLYLEALERDSANAFAMLGAARLLVGGFDDEANGYLEPLLTDESRHAGARAAAWLLVARIALENSRPEQAEEALGKAAGILEGSEWPPLELYAVHAAADLLRNVTESSYTQKSLDYNPTWGDIYAIPAHFYVITRRYREAIDLYQRAVDIQPDHAPAHEDMGVNLLRDNQVSRARRHLERAYALDPFSPRAVNTLRLLDSFENFRVINDPAEPTEGELPIVFRLHSREADAIVPYAAKLARDSIAVFTERYGFELREPVIVEMYPDHEDFAVRTAGMPGIGILGATFGYVVAMDSPSSRPPNEFQWGTTLWHEMAHVFTLESTDHLVPRWFSEGVSVFEEWRSGPTPGVRIPMTVYNAMREDLLLPIAELDEGFIRPTYDEQVIVSYMQAGLVCQFIDERFGPEALRQLLDAFRTGQQTAEAIESVMRIPPGEFDEQFGEFVDREHGVVLDNFEEWHETQERVGVLLDQEAWQDVIDEANRLLELLPSYAEPDSPYLAIAHAEEALGNDDAALAALQRFWENGGFDPDALKQLGHWLSDAGRDAEAIAVWQTVNMVDPLDAELHGALGDLLLQAGRPREALTEYDVLLALDPHDKAMAWYRLAKANHALGERQRSQEQLLQALDVAPNFRPAQKLLLELMRGAGDGKPNE